MITLDEKRMLQVHRACNYFEMESSFACSSSSIPKKFKNDIEIKSHLIDDRYTLMDIETNGKTFLTISGVFYAKKGRKFMMLKQKLSAQKQGTMSGFVKVTANRFAYLLCDKDSCTVLDILVDKRGFSVETVGIIDELFVKKEKFCPKKIITYSEDNQSFLVESQCEGEKGSDLIKFLLHGRLMIYDSFMRVGETFKNFSLCSHDLFAFYNEGESKVQFRRYDTPIYAEDNEVDLADIGIDQIHQINCRFSSIFVVGKKLENGKRDFAILEKRSVGGGAESYIDNK